MFEVEDWMLGWVDGCLEGDYISKYPINEKSVSWASSESRRPKRKENKWYITLKQDVTKDEIIIYLLKNKEYLPNTWLHDLIGI